jgi:hypothetical protein
MKNTGLQSLNYHTDILLDFKESSGERIFSRYWKCVHDVDAIMSHIIFIYKCPLSCGVTHNQSNHVVVDKNGTQYRYTVSKNLLSVSSSDNVVDRYIIKKLLNSISNIQWEPK